MIYNYKNKALQNELPQTDHGSSKTVTCICQTAGSHILKDHKLKTQQGSTTPALPQIPSKRVQG